MLKSRIAGTTLLLLASSCAVQDKLEVRPVGASLVHTAKPQSARIAEAKAHLALGNVALALEQYRIAAREDANSVEALSGMANCYQRLGRPELAERQLELALAIRPDDPALLTALAALLDARGLATKAAMVRAEIPAEPVIALTSKESSMTLGNSEPKPVEHARQDTASLPSPVVSKPAESQIASMPALPAPPVHAAEPASVLADVKAARPPIAAPAKTVTVKLPEVTPVVGATPVGKAVGRSVTVALAPVRAPAVAPTATRSPASVRKPQLERLSLGEVALRTSGEIQWTNLVRPISPRAPTPNLIAARSQLQILNGARVQGLAGSARAMLMRRGWRAIAVSDARKVHAVSVLYVPKHRVRLASRLAAQFSFPVQMKPSNRDFILVLGANAHVKRAGA